MQVVDKNIEKKWSQYWSLRNKNRLLEELPLRPSTNLRNCRHFLHLVCFMMYCYVSQSSTIIFQCVVLVFNISLEKPSFYYTPVEMILISLNFKRRTFEYVPVTWWKLYDYCFNNSLQKLMKQELTFHNTSWHNRYIPLYMHSRRRECTWLLAWKINRPHGLTIFGWREGVRTRFFRGVATIGINQRPHFAGVTFRGRYFWGFVTFGSLR